MVGWSFLGVGHARDPGCREKSPSVLHPSNFKRLRASRPFYRLP